MADPYDLNNIALRRRAIADGRAVVVRPVTRETLRKELGDGSWTAPDESGFSDRCWQLAEIHAALVRLGVAKE